MHKYSRNARRHCVSSENEPTQCRPLYSSSVCGFCSSAAGLPCSATSPSFRTAILSAASTVRIRCAMTSTLFPASSRDKVPRTFVSFSTSREAVASSSRTMGAFFSRARRGSRSRHRRGSPLPGAGGRFPGLAGPPGAWPDGRGSAWRRSSRFRRRIHRPSFHVVSF